ncbi:hypothetical protein BDZ85DRAFT_266028 [Elsinoe ampelina]|uniref:NADH-ubiquinone reductase complex 1 MLRQ subunit-domain-containing protein n=1 Tax=Elsinoe ampelina TaxID=302913 RepID=A0A6A6G584_9PEZI|nr:hypothetical protein BDZ85DRAFT_266028 [Elsinoe ampelina]
MISTRAITPLAQTMRLQPVMQAFRAPPASKIAQQTRGIKFQGTPRMKSPVPREEHSAHTISQRLRTLKKIPPELIPLGVVLGVALAAAGYSMIHKLYVDGTLRLTRQGKRAANPDH